MVRTVQTARSARRRRQQPSRSGAAGLLSAAVLGGAAASIGMLVTGTGTPVGPALTPAAIVAPAVDPQRATGPATPDGEAAPAAPKTQKQQDADVLAQPNAVAFLGAMRAAKLPTSRNGLAEVLTAKAACAELAKGTSEDDLVRRIPVGLPTVTRKQAAIMVDLAQKHYC